MAGWAYGIPRKARRPGSGWYPRTAPDVVSTMGNSVHVPALAHKSRHRAIVKRLGILKVMLLLDVIP